MNIRRNQERGSALLVAVVITLMVVAISGAFISHAMVRQRNSVNLMFGSQAVTAASASAWVRRAGGVAAGRVAASTSPANASGIARLAFAGRRFRSAGGIEVALTVGPAIVR